MAEALWRALADLRDPAIARMLLVIAVVSAVACAILVAAIAGGVMAFDAGAELQAAAPWLPAWLTAAIVAVAATLGSLVLLWFTFAAVVHTVASFFLDSVVARVEARRYPELGAAPQATLAADIVSALRFLGWLLLVNLAATPLYVVGLLVPGLSAVAFWLVNSVLFAREYAEIVLLRRHGQAAAGAWRRRHRWRLLPAGALITLGMGVPLLNLCMPVIGAALMTHLCHGTADGD